MLPGARQPARMGMEHTALKLTDPAVLRMVAARWQGELVGSVMPQEATRPIGTQIVQPWVATRSRGEPFAPKPGKAYLSISTPRRIGFTSASSTNERRKRARHLRRSERPGRPTLCRGRPRFPRSPPSLVERAPSANRASTSKRSKLSSKLSPTPRKGWYERSGWHASRACSYRWKGIAIPSSRRHGLKGNTSRRSRARTLGLGWRT